MPSARTRKDGPMDRLTKKTGSRQPLYYRIQITEVGTTEGVESLWVPTSERTEGEEGGYKDFPTEKPYEQIVYQQTIEPDEFNQKTVIGALNGLHVPRQRKRKAATDAK